MNILFQLCETSISKKYGNNLFILKVASSLIQSFRATFLIRRETIEMQEKERGKTLTRPQSRDPRGHELQTVSIEGHVCCQG